MLIEWLNCILFNSFMLLYDFRLLAEKYSAVVIPHCPGALSDLAEDQNLGQILKHFARNQSMSLQALTRVRACMPIACNL